MTSRAETMGHILLAGDLPLLDFDLNVVNKKVERPWGVFALKCRKFIMRLCQVCDSPRSGIAVFRLANRRRRGQSGAPGSE